MRFALIVSLLISLNVWPQSTCPSYNHIYLIHGIGGNAKSFGQMEAYLKRLDECFKVDSFEYDTGNSSLSTYDFAVSFNDFVLKKISHQEIAANDKISLIMHSQGGLVGNLWLHSIGENNPALLQKVDSFITLSTPHWGAEIANIGKHLFFTLPEGIRNPISPFGRIELNEMNYGSRTIENLNSIISRGFSTFTLRPLALGGIHKIKNKLLGENDTVVPVFSSRPDHYFANLEININDAHDVIALSAFTKTNRVPFVTVPATHLKLDLPGIATVPATCLTNENCGHPALPFITNHLKGRSIASITEKLDHFRCSLYLKNATGAKIEKKDVQFEILTHDQVTLPLPQKLKGYRADAKRDEGIAFSFHGHTKNHGVQQVKILVSVKDKFRRIIEVPVEGGYSSLIQVTLK